MSGQTVQPDDRWVKMVQDALAHLYDYAYLCAHPLTDELRPGSNLPPRERMRSLRTEILQAIEELRSPSDEASCSAIARSYHVLTLRYVEEMVVSEVARELAMSERQVYRELRKAERELALLLYMRYQHRLAALGRTTGPISRAQMVLEEAERLSGQVVGVQISELVANAASAVATLAMQRHILLQAESPPGAAWIYTDQQIARQALVNILSHALQHAQPGTSVCISAMPDDMGTEIVVAFALQEPSQSLTSFPAAAQGLAQRLKGRCWAEPAGGNRMKLVLRLGAFQRRRVLIIDDNQALIELFRRYLSDSHLDLLTAQDGREGTVLAETHLPDVVILDVMMPHQDGWEILQRIHHGASTRHIPIIVCSVIDDPGLARSLGASIFLSKPVSRSTLLAAIDQCLEHSPPLTPAELPADS